jgi:hypothetical protein
MVSISSPLFAVHNQSPRIKNYALTEAAASSDKKSGRSVAGTGFLLAGTKEW